MGMARAERLSDSYLFYGLDRVAQSIRKNTVQISTLTVESRPSRSLRSADGSLSFVLFVQEGSDRRSSGFTAECRTSLLPFQRCAV